MVIFVTAYDEYALRAFEVHAFDYLLKPFDQPRFAKTIERARRQLSSDGRSSEKLLDLLKEFRQRSQEPARFAIKTPGRLFFVRQEDIDWMEAADNYVNLHTGHETHLIRETMNALEQRLDSHKFLRIHRSTMVNADRIKELRPWFHGEYIVVLKDGTELTLSRTYREKILNLLGS
jgi:two-component system LytT family response regulator